jgi:hypothetical protein
MLKQTVHTVTALLERTDKSEEMHKVHVRNIFSYSGLARFVIF